MGRPKCARRKVFYFGLSSLVLFLFPLAIYHSDLLRNELSAKSSVTNDTTAPKNSPKLILFWNKFFNFEHPDLHTSFSDCAVQSCETTNDRSRLPESTAVVIHAGNVKIQDLPPSRHPGQYFVFFLMENAFRTTPNFRLPMWKNYFNLTWTYRSDSDVVSVFYLNLYGGRSLWNKERGNELGKKKNAAASLVSHCRAESGRDVYIEKLGRYFQVDSLGKCGSKNREWTQYESVIGGYKFYLAFENGFCKDYITEKPMRAFQQETVPVVMGSGNYTAVFPPKSFINTADFASPKALGEYLTYLSKNLTAYEEYFEWKYDKNHLSLPYKFQPSQNDACQLCELLHRKDAPVQVYEDIYEWWMEWSNCVIPFEAYREWMPLPVHVVLGGFIGLGVMFSVGYWRYRRRPLKS